jgi:hypothetical protein
MQTFAARRQEIARRLATQPWCARRARMLGFSSLEYQGSGNVVVVKAMAKTGGGPAQV